MTQSRLPHTLLRLRRLSAAIMVLCLAPALLLVVAGCGPGETDAPAEGEAVAVDGAQATSAVVDEAAGDNADDAAADAAPEAEDAAGGEAGGTSSAVGIYKGFFPGASSPGLDGSLYLNTDGSLRLVSDYLNEEPPIEEVGTWREAEGEVEITLSGQVDREYDEPETRVLRLGENRLTTTDWIGPWWRLEALATGLEPPYDAALAASSIEDRGFLGYYKHFAPSASCCGQDYTLLLGIDDLARLTTNFHNGEPPLVDEGTWTIDEEGRARVTLTRRVGGADFTSPITFALANQDGLLEAVDYDERMLGEAGLTFYLYPALAMAQIAATEEEVEAGVTPVSLASPEEIVGLTWALQEMQLADASVLTPGAPTDYTLRFAEDGTAEIKADCNQGRGSYELSAPYLRLDQLALTRAQCAPGSLHDSYVESLGTAGSAVLLEGELVISTAGGGRLRFASSE